MSFWRSENDGVREASIGGERCKMSRLSLPVRTTWPSKDDQPNRWKVGPELGKGLDGDVDTFERLDPCRHE